MTSTAQARLLDLFGIELPIIQGPMALASTPEMAIAVSEAGGLGSLAGAQYNEAGLRAALDTVRAGTRRPINVNFFCHTPPAEDPARQAAWLKQYSDVAIQVEGHADERGTREYNISLSARRATATRAFLIAQGIDEHRISSIAYGKERPAALCDAEQCWSQNRRTVTVITSGAKTS